MEARFGASICCSLAHFPVKACSSHISAARTYTSATSSSSDPSSPPAAGTSAAATSAAATPASSAPDSSSFSPSPLPANTSIGSEGRSTRLTTAVPIEACTSGALPLGAHCVTSLSAGGARACSSFPLSSFLDW